MLQNKWCCTKRNRKLSKKLLLQALRHCFGNAIIYEAKRKTNSVRKIEKHKRGRMESFWEFDNFSLFFLRHLK